ncbi:MAG: 16S rRNA (adenine(1518)-N(6)/adenine(1519)-N(6))-dimethyltransferase RsmA [Elusimicrobiota bacterium]
MKKKLGQHFLTNPDTAERIARILNIKQDENIMEIGPGKGFLTSFLIDYGAKVKGIEIDGKLASLLRKKFSEKDLSVINEDFLRIDIERFNSKKICGNIPYQITGKIIEKIVTTKWSWEKAVLMIPYPVALRVTAHPGESDYSALTAICRVNCDTKIEFKVSAEDFEPPPKIESAVVAFLRRKSSEDSNYYEVVKAAFSKKRKKIKNSLKMYFSISDEDAIAVLNNSGISPGQRAQAVDVESFKRLTREVVNKNIL